MSDGAAPTNSAGSGAIAGIGVGNPDKSPTWGEPGRDMKKKTKADPNLIEIMLRRVLSGDK